MCFLIGNVSNQCSEKTRIRLSDDAGSVHIK